MTAPALSVARGRPWRGVRPALVTLPILLVYVVLVGGTPAGEVNGELRVINAAVGVALVGWVLLGARFRIDRVDVGVAAATALFTLSGVFSIAPRQSLDAGLAALAYTVTFIAARRLASIDATRIVLQRTMMGLSVVVVGLMTIRLVSIYAAWGGATGWAGVPPIGLVVNGAPWGHPYDMALLGAITTPAWFTGDPGRGRRLLGILISTLLTGATFLIGSRSIWLACAAAGFVLMLQLAYRGGLRSIVGLVRAHAVIAATLTLGMVLIGIVVAERLLVTATIGQRLAMWTAGVGAWLERPWTGGGPATFPWILQTTDYFDTHSIAPRHPDSALFQIIPELGLVGLAIVVVLAATVGATFIRRADRPSVWIVVVFLVAGLGSNPSDFSFLVAIFIVWVAIATRVPTEVPGRRLVNRGVVVVLGTPIVLALAAAAAGGLLYDRASQAVVDGRLADARAALDQAVMLDPGMALYVRQRGTLELLTGQTDRAIKDLESATSINPNDDLAWRTLAVAYLGAKDSDAASAALAVALKLQRSDPSNLLLAVAADSPSLPASDLIAEAVQAWPELVMAPGWNDLIPANLTTEQVLIAARDRWTRSDASPEPRADQPLTIALLLGDAAAARAAGDAAGLGRDLVSAQIAVVSCARGALDVVRHLRPTPSSSYYWSIVLQVDGLEDGLEERATDAYQVLTGRTLSLPPDARVLNPLRENDSLGYSGDVWGYRRSPIEWPFREFHLPSPRAGRIRWIVMTHAAIQEAGLADRVGCRGHDADEQRYARIWHRGSTIDPAHPLTLARSLSTLIDGVSSSAVHNVDVGPAASVCRGKPCVAIEC